MGPDGARVGLRVLRGSHHARKARERGCGPTDVLAGVGTAPLPSFSRRTRRRTRSGCSGQARRADRVSAACQGRGDDGRRFAGGFWQQERHATRQQPSHVIRCACRWRFNPHRVGAPHVSSVQAHKHNAHAGELPPEPRLVRMSISKGDLIGPYEIVGWIGAGGMGEVYRARDPRLGREVAIKLIAGSMAKDANRVHRFEQEARARRPAQSPERAGGLRCRQLRRHPLHHLGTARRRIAWQPPSRRTVADAESRRIRTSNRRGARRRARQAHRSPRREARERVRHQRRAHQDP